MGFFTVQWKSHEFHPDGRKRSRPPASSVHGWLMKWRGTFSGDEKVRTQGMREMREASAVRNYKHNMSGNKIARADSTRPPLTRSASTKDATRSTSTRPAPPVRSASMKNPEPRRSTSTRTPQRSESMRSPPKAHQRSMSMQTPRRSDSMPTPRRSESGSRSTQTPASPRPPVSRRATGTSSRPGTGSGRSSTPANSGSLNRRKTSTSRKN